MSTQALPQSVNRQIMQETMARFSGQEKSEIARQLRDTESTVYQYMQQRRSEEAALITLVKEHFSEVDETEILRQLDEKKGEAWDYYIALPAIIKEADFDKNYRSWKKNIIILTGIVSVANGAVGGIGMGALAMGGLTLWSFRSSKLLAAANGCACLALIILSNSICNYAEGVHKHSVAIQALSVENSGEFSSTIDQNYAELEKSIFVFHSYFGARKRALGKTEHQGLQLLREELNAIQAIPIYWMTLQSSKKSSGFLNMSSIAAVDLEGAKVFFSKFERIAHQGKMLAIGGTLIGAAYLYCAYIQRAYVMIVAGLTYTLMNGALFLAARSYEIGAAAIQETNECNLADIYNNNVAGSLFPKVANCSTLQNVVVIPVDKILRLIPA